MKNILIGFVIGICTLNAFQIFAQRANNWVMASTTGINFNTVPPTPFIKASGAGYSQSISDCKGNLEIYTHNNILYNSKNQVLKGPKMYSGEFNLLIPKPGDDSSFYYFRSVVGLIYPHYLTIDMRKDSARGEVDSVIQPIIDSIPIAAGFVKHSNDTDYWLLLKTNAYTVNAYLVTEKGIDTIPVISKMYGYRRDNLYLKFSNNGKFVIAPSTYGQAPILTSDRTYIYNFDNKIGTCSNGRVLYSKPNSSTPYFDYCFSPNDSLIYQYEIYGNANLRQFETYASVPNLTKIQLYSRTFSGNNYAQSFSLQSAPDNRIYFWETDSGNSSHCLSYIAYPDKKGIECSVQSEKACFWPYLINAQYFPAMFFPIPRIDNHFTISGSDGCGYDSVFLSMDGDSNFKSAWWYFGDGDSTEEFFTRDSLGQKHWQGVWHQYKQEGIYYIRLACSIGSCDYKQYVGDSVSITFRPRLNFSIQKNTFCGNQILSYTALYRYTDTLKVAWGDGTDTIIRCVNNGTQSQIKLSHNYFQNGQYSVSCHIWNAHCSDSSSFSHTVYIQPAPNPKLICPDNKSCGSRIYTFSDTSSADSVVSNRFWGFTKPNGSRYIIINQNDKLDEFLSDTGKYTISLMVQNAQGCSDSAILKEYIHVFPLPDSTIQPNGKVFICFGDSVKLSLMTDLSYLWNTGDTNSFIYVRKTGVYHAQLQNFYKCSSQTSQVVALVLPPFSANIIKTTDSIFIQSNRPIASYYWMRDSMPFSGNQNSSVLNPPPGIYTAIVADTNGCKVKTSALKIINGFPVLNYNKLNIYPNPVHDILFIDGHSLYIEEIYLYDMMGKKILMPYKISQNGIQLDLTGFNKGVYILNLNEYFLKVLIE